MVEFVNALSWLGENMLVNAQEVTYWQGGVQFR